MLLTGAVVSTAILEDEDGDVNQDNPVMDDIEAAIDANIINNEGGGGHQ